MSRRPLRASSRLPRGLAATALAASGLALAPLGATTAFAALPDAAFVAEFSYDNDGGDTGEFVEVQLPAGGTSQGLRVVLYNGNGGGVYAEYALPVVTAPAQVPAVVAIDTPGIQNGSPDGLALVDDTDTVLEFLSYEGTLAATDGPAAGTTSTDIGVSQPGSTPIGQSLARRYHPATGALEWFGNAPATRGEVNPEVAAAVVCDLATTHEIGEVQGPGEETPLGGAAAPAPVTVTVRGVVVGDVPGLSGFYLQDPDGDGDAATSDGIFVFSGVPVDLGDTVAVSGVPSEFFGQTQISAERDVEVCADGDARDLPAPAALDLPAADAERERVEGMLVAPVDTLTVTEVYNLTRYGELALAAGGVLVQPTELARPGTKRAERIAERNLLRSLVLDDGTSQSVSVSTRPYLSPDTPMRVGDRVRFTEPTVLGYGFGAWRLQPADGTAEGLVAPRNTRPRGPDAVGGDLQVGAFNVLNYFLTWSGEQARGARNAEQFERQSAKIVTAIRRLGAEVVALMEVEDTASTGYDGGAQDADLALAELVRRLNEAEGAQVWAYVPFPENLYAVGRDVIRNAIIYRPAAAEPLGDSVGLVDESVWFNAREPVAQTFRSTAGGDVFTVVANHFKSKGSGDEASGDNVDSGDGQGAWNGDRVRQARSLASFADRLRTQAQDPDVVLLGDLNSYGQEDPIRVLRRAGFVDLGPRFDPGRYSYVFDARSGSLDHALATRRLAAKVTDVAHWNINAVESFAYQYSGDPALYASHEFRSSDHDPVLVGLDLRAPRPRDCRWEGVSPWWSRG